MSGHEAAAGGLPGEILDHLEEAIFVSRMADHARRFVLVNRAACELLGYSREDLLEVAPRDLVPAEPARRELYERRLQRVEGGEEIELRLFMKARGGDLVAVKARTWPLFTTGEPLVVSRVVRLPGAEAVEEGEIQPIRRHITELLHLAPIGIAVTDRDGRILFENDRMKETMGLSPREPSPVLGARVQQLPGVVGRPLEAVIRAILDGEPVRNHVSPYTSFAGRDLVCSLDGVPLRDAEGALEGALLVVTDITEQQRMEEEARQAQRLESLAVLAGGVAHDFNNLLEAITGCVALARGALPQGHEAAEPLRNAERLAGRAAARVGQLLSVVQRPPAERRPFDLASALSEAAEVVRSAVGPDVHVELDLPPGEVRVEGSPDQIGQVLHNLAVNAREAMRGCGRLTLRLSTASTPPGDGAALIEMSDTGPGVPAEHRDRVFEPYFTTKTPGGSAGLGLAVAHGIVTSHGGRIEVRSPPGSGATFVIALPLLGPGGPGEGGGGSALPSSPDPGGAAPEPQVVLLVEDEPALRDVFTSLLGRAGYRVVACANGRQAIEAFQAHPEVAAMVLDFQLPDMGGHEVLRAVRAAAPRLPVVISTGYAPEDALSPWIEQPLVRYLQKPFAFRTLVEELAGLLSAAGGVSAPPGPGPGSAPRRGRTA